MGEEMKGKVSLDVSAFEAAAKKAQETAKSFGVSVGKNLGIDSFKGMVAGALSVAGVTTAITSLLDKADNIDALAKRFDLSAESIQSIQFAADQSGASADAMFTGLKKLSIAIDEARSGNADYITSLQSMGVSLDDIKTKNAEQIFYQIGEKANGASVESIKLGDAIKVFGRAGDQVLGAMRDGFADVAKSANAAGVVIQNNMVRELANAKDELAKIDAQFTVLKAKALKGTLEIGAKISDKSLVGWYSKIVGALSGGASLIEAVRVANDVSMEKSINDALAPTKARNKDVSSINQPPVERLKVDRVSVPALNLTANQQIGAYSGQNPILNRQIAIDQAMLDLQRKVAEESKKIATNTERLLTALPVSDYN